MVIKELESTQKLIKCLYMYIGDSGACGLGLFTARNIKKGEIIIKDDDGDFYENTYSFDELVAKGLCIHDFFQVGRDAFVMPNGAIDDFMNHSCSPNCGVRLTPSGYIVLALRDIRRGEQLTYDYSTHQMLPVEGMPCRCGSWNCRKTVENFDRLPAVLRARYVALGVVGSFVLETEDAAPLLAVAE
jgi:uncharacterized protein